MTGIIKRPAVLATILLTSSGLIPLVGGILQTAGTVGAQPQAVHPGSGFSTGYGQRSRVWDGGLWGFLSSVSGTDVTAVGRIGLRIVAITPACPLAALPASRRVARCRFRQRRGSGCLVHGLRNLFGMLVGLVPFIDVTAGLVGFLRGLGVIAPYALVTIAIGLFGS